jgi:nucleoside-diphosphate-sugar epimerase
VPSGPGPDNHPPIRVFLAGATGVIGIRLLPLLIANGDTVAAMTRSPDKTGRIRALGADPVVCDVFDAAALTKAITSFTPDVVLHQLTDLPDHLDQLPDYAARNDRMRTEGTRNLVTAARAAGAPAFPGPEHRVASRWPRAGRRRA